MHVFGLTGGFATGKSTVVGRLRARGVPVVEADVLAREVVVPGSEGLGALVEGFGADILDAEGALDRKRLAGRVFGDDALRARLEGVLHPLIRALMLERMRQLEAEGEPLACYEAPLLVEVGFSDALRPLVVVTVDEPTQIARAKARDGLSEPAIRARLAAQRPLSEKVALADFVIDNSRPLEQTLAETDRVLEAICRRVGVDVARYPSA